MKTIKLNSGYDMPILGLGTYKSQPDQVGQAVEYALLNAGYCHIDGASIYLNEPEIGAVYKEVFKKIDRKTVFITSKLWNTDHQSKDVVIACKKSLHDLHLDYLDLYLMHWGIAFKPGLGLKPVGKDGNYLLDNVPILETWHAMESLVKEGLVKSIGVANFTVMMLVDLLAGAKILPSVNQVELHPYLAQNDLVTYSQSRGIIITAYTPMGRPGGTFTPPHVYEDPIILQIAAKHAKTAPQILLRWGIERNTVVIPKSINPSRIKENINIFDFELDASDISRINSLDKNMHLIIPSDWGVPYFK